MKKFLQFFQDGDGQMSAMRLAFVLTLHVVLAMWVVDCLHSKTMAKFDINTIYLILSLMAGKVGQAFAERDITPK